MPGDIRACGEDRVRICSVACTWGDCEEPECDGVAARACGPCGGGGQTRECVRGAWSAWSPCDRAPEVCEPGDVISCDGGGAATCNDRCEWSACAPEAPSCPPDNPLCAIALSNDGAHLYVHGDAFRLHDGQPLSRVIRELGGRSNLCMRELAVNDWRVHGRETRVRDDDGDGWLELRLPPLLEGIAPYGGCPSCGGLPFQVSLYRCGADALGDWLDTGQPGEPRSGDFLAVTPDELCRERWAFAVSYTAERGYFASGAEIMAQGCDEQPERECEPFELDLHPVAGERLDGVIEWWPADGTPPDRTPALPDGGRHHSRPDACAATVDLVEHLDRASSTASGALFGAQPLCPLPAGGLGAAHNGACVL